MSKRQRAFIYARVSENRGEETLAVDRQLEACRALADREGLDVIEVFHDDGVSAYSGVERPGFERMLSRLSEVDYVIAWAYDRLVRLSEDFLRLRSAQKAAGVRTFTHREGEANPADVMDMLLPGIRALFSEAESDQRSARVTAKSHQTIASGRHTGGVRPFGFNLIPRTDDEVRNKMGHRYALNEREAEAIRKAADDILEKGRSLGSIAREWNDPERPGGPLLTVYGRPWTLTPLRKVLLRPRNMGVLTVGKEEVSSGAIPHILETSVYLALKNHLTRRSTPGHTNKAKHLMTGIVECQCGEPAKHATVGSRTVEPTTGERVRHGVYRCRQKGGGHTGKRREFVDAVVKSAVYELLTMDLSQRVGLSPEQEAQREELERRLKTITYRRELVGRQMASGEADGTMVRAAREQLDVEEQEIQAELASLHESSPPDPSALPPFAPERLELEQRQADDAYLEFATQHIDDQREFIRHQLRVRMLPMDPRTPRMFDPATVQVTARTGLDPENLGPWYWHEDPKDSGYRAPLIRDGERVGVQVWDGPVVGQPVGADWSAIEDFHERREQFDRLRVYLEELEASAGIEDFSP